VKSITILVEGKVQGVWFRKSTQTEANRIGIKGFVKNQSNGSVYIEAEGTKEQLEAFIAWCHEGPKHALVSFLEVTEVEVLKGFTEFQISYR
jgi:acylphosphatase